MSWDTLSGVGTDVPREIDAGLPDLKGKARALRSFDKDLAKITKVAESQGTGSLLKPHIG